jgi:hypothetical protein
VVQDFQDRVDRGQDVRLRPPEGGQPQGGQPELQWTEVVASEGEIMQEVPSAVSVVGMYRLETSLRHGRVGHHIRSDGCELPENGLDLRASPASVVIGVFHGHRHLLRRPKS